MARVMINAGHVVEIEGDEPLAELVKLATDLHGQTRTDPQHGRGLGFTTSTSPKRPAVRRMYDPRVESGSDG